MAAHTTTIYTNSLPLQVISEVAANTKGDCLVAMAELMAKVGEQRAKWSFAELPEGAPDPGGKL